MTMEKTSDALHKLKDSGVQVHIMDDMRNCSKEDAYKIVAKISELSAQPPKNVFIQIREWKKLGEKMTRYIEEISAQIQIFAERSRRYESAAAARNFKRWTPGEDEFLIEMVCDGVHPFEISATLGRTIPAIKTRVSTLTGLKRISQEIAGKFVGKLNGSEVEGNIDGILYRQEETAEVKK